MKKISFVCWAVIFIVAFFVLIVGNARADVIAAPEIFERSADAGIQVEAVAVVDFDWESVHRLDEVVAMVFDDDAKDVRSVILTDGIIVARAKIVEMIGEGELLVMFDTGQIRQFSTRYAYLFIVKTVTQ